MKHLIRGVAAACIAFLSVGADASQPASRQPDSSGTLVPAEVTMDALGRVLSVTTPEGTTSYRYFEGTNEPLIQEVSKPDGTREQYSLDVATSAYNALLGSAASSSSSSNPCSGTNRFGFNGYLWECELGSYLTPSGRLYDPELGRFLQQDTYLGDISNAPSLHRYTFGHDNPTSFVDPTGHESYRQWILLDKPSPSVGHEFLKHVGYNAFNLVSFGALARQDTLVEQSEAGRITEGQYQGGTAINAAGTGVTAAATFATGGVAGQVIAGAGGSLVLAGAAGGGTAGLVASTGSADVDIATGTRSPLDIHASEFVAPTLLGAASGAAFGAGTAAGVRPFAGPLPAPPTSGALVVTEGPGSVVVLVPAEGAAPVRPPRVTWVDEKAAMSPSARDYQAAASGARSNVQTRFGQAPEIEYSRTPGIVDKVRFDGQEGTVLIDRKTSVTTFEKSQNQALRQSEALSQNGLTGRWEVPSAAEASRATACSRNSPSRTSK